MSDVKSDVKIGKYEVIAVDLSANTGSTIVSISTDNKNTSYQEHRTYFPGMPINDHHSFATSSFDAKSGEVKESSEAKLWVEGRPVKDYPDRYIYRLSFPQSSSGSEPLKKINDLLTHGIKLVLEKGGPEGELLITGSHEEKDRPLTPEIKDRLKAAGVDVDKLLALNPAKLFEEKREEVHRIGEDMKNPAVKEMLEVLSGGRSGPSTVADKPKDKTAEMRYVGPVVE